MLDVTTELLKLPRSRKVNGKEIAIPCPFHQHRTGNGMSLYVSTGSESVSAGVWHCWSCGASGHWNKLAQELGLEQMPRDTESIWVPSVTFSERYAPPAIESIESQMDDDLDDWVRDDHTIYRETLLRCGCKHWSYVDNNFDLVERIWLPSVQHRQFYGHVGIDTQAEKSMRYKNSTGNWVTDHFVCYDAALQISKKYVVVVEGPADAMRLIQNNIPAVALCGVPHWKKVGWLCQEDIVLCLDNDPAGELATFNVKSNWQSESRLLEYRHEWHDAAEASCSEIKKFKTWLR